MALKNKERPNSPLNKDYTEHYPCGHVFINSCRRCRQTIKYVKLKTKKNEKVNDDRKPAADHSIHSQFTNRAMARETSNLGHGKSPDS
jgi:hypothetical protein